MHINSDRLNDIARRIALISFLLGTVIFLLYFFSSAYEWLVVGYGYILIAGIANTAVLLLLLFKANKDKGNRTRLLKTAVFVLLNIPVALLYCLFTLFLLNTMRITFTNATPSTLTDINIAGCGGGHIDKLETEDSKTVWVHITGDCSISLDYLANGQRKKEVVVGYVTGTMGQRMKYNIGGQNEEIF